MPSLIDNYLGIHPQALKLAARRNELLASNLANADTPNYKARDIDFKQALAATTSGNASVAGQRIAMSGAALGVTQAAHIPLTTINSQAQAAEQYRVPLASSLDGNTVDAQIEQASFAQNSVRYQATLTLINAKFRSLITAITGQ